MKLNKYKNKIKKIKKIQETKLDAIPRFPAGSFAVHVGDHLRDHLRFNLGIISGLGNICGRGSFAALYNTDQPRHKNMEGLISLFLFFDFQTYVNLEVYDDKDYVNFDVVT